MGGLVRASSLSAHTAPAVAQSMAAAAPSSYVLQLAGLSSSTCAEMHSPQDWPASVSEKEDLMKKCEEWVKDEIATCDASHDWCHVHRVRRQAVNIAQEEALEAKIPGAMLVVELAALLHDVKDYKYSGSDTAGIEAAASFLKALSVPPPIIARILQVIENVSYKKELASMPNLCAGEVLPLGDVTELACVQDADRLDAIGAVGIARCFTFGGAMKRVIYDAHVPARTELTAAMYQDGKSTTLNHFHEKLLKLKSLMKTATGRKLAESRHQYMLDFLEQFQLEAGM